MPSTFISSLLPKKVLRAQSNSESATASQKQTSKKASRKQQEAPVIASLRRNHICDVRGGPLPPRGSLTQEKLAYLDWRLGYIRDARMCSEKTNVNWADGRDTIGRTSFEIVECIQDNSNSDEEWSSHALYRINSSNKDSKRRSKAAYTVEREEAEKVLKQAIMADTVIASMPLLARDSSHCDSKRSASSDESGGKDEAGSKNEVRLRPVSLLHRASLKLDSANRSRRLAAAEEKFFKSEATKSNALRGRLRPVSRLWQH